MGGSSSSSRSSSSSSSRSRSSSSSSRQREVKSNANKPVKCCLHLQLLLELEWMAVGALLSSVFPAVAAAPAVYDVHAFVVVCAFYVCLYVAGGAVLPLLSKTYAKWNSDSGASSRCDVARIAAKEMRRFRLYVGSTVNSVICVSIAAVMLADASLLAPSAVASAGTRLACWFLSGYFVADLFLGMRDASEFPSEVIHHVFGLSLVSSFLVADSALQYTIAPYGFWFFISESSTIPLNLIYMLEKTGAPASSASVYVLQRLFLLCFVVCRVLLMPAFAGVHLSFFSDIPFSPGFVFAATSCWSLSILQFYFFKVVIDTIREKTGSREQVRPLSFSFCFLRGASILHKRDAKT
jgi:hypothetical protein